MLRTTPARRKRAASSDAPRALLDQDIAARTPVESVRAGPTDEDVVAGTAEQRVISAAVRRRDYTLTPRYRLLTSSSFCSSSGSPRKTTSPFSST